MDLNYHLTQPFGVWLGGGGGGGKSVTDAGNKGGIHEIKSSLDSAMDAGNKGGIHGLKSSLDSAIWGLVGGVGGW